MGRSLYWLWLVVAFASAGFAQEKIPTTLSFDEEADGPVVDSRTLEVQLTSKKQLTITLRPAPTSATRPAADDAARPAEKLAGLETGSVKKDGDVFVIAYDFSRGSGAEDFGVTGAKVEGGVLGVEPNTPNAAGKKFSSLRLPRLVRTPLNVNVTPSAALPTHGVGLFWPNGDGKEEWLDIHVGEARLVVNRVTNNDWAARKTTEVPIKPNEPTHISMLLPAAHLPTEAPISVRFSGGHSKLELARFQVRGRVVGRFGVGFGPSLAVATLVDGPGMRAGLQPGDVLTKIDAFAPKTPVEAAEFLKRFSPGDKSIWTVRRDGKTARVQVVAE
jgi:hypothetical protein